MGPAGRGCCRPSTRRPADRPAGPSLEASCTASACSAAQLACFYRAHIPPASLGLGVVGWASLTRCCRGRSVTTLLRVPASALSSPSFSVTACYEVERVVPGRSVVSVSVAAGRRRRMDLLATAAAALALAVQEMVGPGSVRMQRGEPRTQRTQRTQALLASRPDLAQQRQHRQPPPGVVFERERRVWTLRAPRWPQPRPQPPPAAAGLGPFGPRPAGLPGLPLFARSWRRPSPSRASALRPSVAEEGWRGGTVGHVMTSLPTAVPQVAAGKRPDTPGKGCSPKLSLWTRRGKGRGVSW